MKVTITVSNFTASSIKNKFPEIYAKFGFGAVEHLAGGDVKMGAAAMLDQAELEQLQSAGIKFKIIE